MLWVILLSACGNSLTCWEVSALNGWLLLVVNSLTGNVATSIEWSHLEKEGAIVVMGIHSLVSLNSHAWTGYFIFYYVTNIIVYNKTSYMNSRHTWPLMRWDGRGYDTLVELVSGTHIDISGVSMQLLKKQSKPLSYNKRVNLIYKHLTIIANKCIHAVL